MKRLFLSFSICAALLIGLAACESQPAEQNASQLKKTWIVATDTTLIPMSFVNDEKEYAGFEIDLIHEIANLAGADVKIISVEWPGLFGGLLTNKFDMVISSVTILEERKRKMAFSAPYLTSGLALVTRREGNDIASIEDAVSKRLKVGAQTGTTAFFYLEKQEGIQKKSYQIYGHAITDLINGELDAVLGESSATLYLKNRQKEYFEKIKMVGEILTEENYGIALRKEDGDRLNQVNQALRELLRNGTVSRLHKKWELGSSSKVPLDPGGSK